MVNGEDIFGGEIADESSVMDTKMIRGHSYKFRETIQGASRMEIKLLKKKKESVIRCR